MRSQAEQGKNQRRLAVATTALFAAAAGIFGLFFYQQPPKFAQAATVNNLGLDPASQEKTRQANIARAAIMRDHWRAWAEQHKDLLIEMRHASGDSTDLATHLNESLPNFKANGLPHSDLQSGGVEFTWQPTGTKNYFTSIKDPKRLASLSTERQIINKQFEEGLAKHKDVIVSRSVNVGPTYIALWASGRVTQSTSYEVREGRGYVSKDGEPQEIQPPFDFIR